MTIRGIRYASGAEEDLISIWQFIAADSPRAADRTLDQIHERVSALIEFPKTGLRCDELAPGVRRVVIGNYLCFYKEEADHVLVLRVLHGKRDITADDLDMSA